MKSIKNKLMFLSFPYENDNEVHGFDSAKFAEFCGVEKTKYVCRGGFFGGHRERIKKFNGEYYSILYETFNADCMGTEENFHTILTYRHPDDTHRYELTDNGLVYPFFEMLSKVEKYNHPNADLIPWNKKKTAEELKTSMYVLTFNSPQQFESLVKSYQENGPDFLDRTRKILIDNSTDSMTYSVYNELCRKYNFEHIKKEINLGICGARQFIAEHFNESDSEYYIFLEDDMTLHGPTEELCDAGFRRYVDSLYLKSLEIIHKNRYDYLKLSYSEFYGTNNTQWAWYNVPQDVREKYFPEKTKLPTEGLDPDPPKMEIFREKRFKDLKYFEGEFYYCNWPLWFSREGNKKVFLDTKWSHPHEQTWMSNVFQLQKQEKIKAAALALSPIFHHRFDFYTAEERKES
jgi:glycosyltransferase involved in cell wall biosynthesis